MSELIIHFLQEVMADVVRRPLGPGDEQEAQAELSRPLFKVHPAGCCALMLCTSQTRHTAMFSASQGNWEAHNNTCLMGEQMKALVTSHDPGFEWINEGTDEVRRGKHRSFSWLLSVANRGPTVRRSQSGVTSAQHRAARSTLR